MKRFLPLLTLLLAVTLLLSACGEYNPAVKLPGQNQTADAGDSGFAGQLQQCQIYQKKQSGG